MAVDYFLIAGDRLGSVDVLLPLAHSIKAEVPEARIWLIFVEDRAFVQLCRDQFLRETSSRITHRVVRLAWDTVPFFVSVWRLIPVLVAMTLRKGYVVIHPRGVNSVFMRALLWLTRVRAGRFFEVPPQQVPIFPRPVKGDQFSGDEGTGFLCFSERDLAHLKELGRTRIRPIGYPRMFDAWLEYVEAVAPRYAESRDDPTDRGKTVAVFLGSTVEGIFGLDEQREWIKDVIQVLRSAMPQSRLLVKPHPTTEPEILRSLLANLNDPDVAGTYLHPALVASQATFVVARHSSTILDALAAGRIVIQYQVFTDAWMRVHPEKSIYPDLGAVLAENKSELIDVIKSVLAGDLRSPDVDDLLGHVEDLAPLIDFDEPRTGSDT